MLRRDRRGPAGAVAAALVLGAFLVARAAAAVPDPETRPRADAENPVRGVSQMMKTAAGLLEKLQTGEPTQDEQKKILEELDRLIAMAQKACSSSSSRQQQQQQQQQADPKDVRDPQNAGGASGGNRPMDDERDVLRSVSPDLGEGAPDLREIWGRLPDARRDEILQLLSEPLPLKYKDLIVRYLKAISEGR